MAVRDVIVRLFGDDKDLTAKLDNADRKLSEFAKSNPTAKLAVNDDNASLILDDLKAKLTDYGRMSETARLKVDDTQALAAIDKLDLKMMLAGKKLDSLGKNMDLSGLTRARSEIGSIGRALDKMGGGSSGGGLIVGGGGGGRRGGLIGNLIGRLFGGGGGGGVAADAAGAAEGGGGSVGKDALSTLGGANNYLMGGGIAALIAAALSITPAILPFALGGGVGIGGALGALALGRTAGTKITADKLALAQAQAALAGSKTGGSASQLLALHTAQRQLSHDQGLYGGFLPFNSSVSALGRSAIGTFLSALTSKGSGGGGSFLSGITGIVNQLGPFLKSMGPELGQMFRASLPFVQTMVKVMEQFAQAVMPAITQSMKELKPYLPQIMQGFKFLSQGIADFIKNLGPGMRTSVTVFKALMDATKGILIGLAYTADFLAWVFARFGHNIMVVSHDIRQWFDEMRHAVALAFDWIVKRVTQDADNVTHTLDSWRHNIAHIFDMVRHDIASAWDAIWNNTIGRVQRGVHDVEHWIGTLPGGIKGIFSKLPGEMVSIGIHILTGLLNGLKSAGASVLSWIGGFVSSIPGKFMSLLGIHSPSTVMHNIGLSIGQGLALGMDHSTGLVNLSASRLAHSIPAMFTAPGAHTGRVYPGGSNMGGMPELIISAQGDALLKAIVRALRYEIKTNGGGNVQKHLGWGSV